MGGTAGMWGGEWEEWAEDQGWSGMGKCGDLEIWEVGKAVKGPGWREGHEARRGFGC